MDNIKLTYTSEGVRVVVNGEELKKVTRVQIDLQPVCSKVTVTQHNGTIFDDMLGETTRDFVGTLVIDHEPRPQLTQVEFLQELSPTEYAKACELRQAGAVLQAACHQAALAAGWWTDLENGRALAVDVPQKLMLIVSEAAEALEGDRKGLSDDKLPWRPMTEVELADIVIRTFDLAGAMGYDLGGAIAEKMAMNARRADHKIENRKAAGGKRY